MRHATSFVISCTPLCVFLLACSGDSKPVSLDGTTGSSAPTTGVASGTSGAATGASGTTGGSGADAGAVTTGTGGSGTGTDSSTSGGSSADGGTCEEREVMSERTAPDMLIVLDRSGSMSDEDNQVDRWAGSVDAINTITAELDDVVRFGLMTFPGAGPSSGGGGWGDDDDECAAGTLDVPIDVMNANPIATTLAGMDADGRTPTAQTLQEARQVLAETESEALSNGEFSVPNQYVLLVTDGDPNCMDADGDDDTAAQQASIAEVEGLAADGVQTYVIGFQTAGSEFAGVLDAMAAAGATGDTMHRSVESGEALLDELRSIAGSAASCSFVLNQEVDESRVEILVDDNPAEYGTGWDLRDDQRTVDLLGTACEALRAGATVNARVYCEIVNVI